MQKVFFHYADKTLNIDNKRAIQKAVESLYESEHKSMERIDYIFCSDEYLLDINKQFLQHDFYTDIVTFDLSENRETIIGEIYVSVDRIKDNATTLKQPLKNEILRVIFHGSLHLCGYKDKKETDIKMMRSKENFYIEKYLGH